MPPMPEQYEEPGEDSQGLDGGIHFLEKFRMKNGGGVALPEFETDTWDNVVRLCKLQGKPMFFYLHNDQGDSCTIVDNTVIGNELVHSFLVDKFVCFGLN